MAGDFFGAPPPHLPPTPPPAPLAVVTTTVASPPECPGVVWTATLHLTSAGELALLSADKRAATVTATTDSTVLMIDRGAFERVLGSLKGLQDASTQNRQ